MLFVSISMMALSYFIEIDSYYDLLFESNSLFLTIYIYFISRKVIKNNRILMLGLLLLASNQAYDVITEIKVLDDWANRHDLTHTFLEDGVLQISFLLIAFGVTRLLQQAHHEAALDELTGLYNRKELSSIKKSQFDVIYFDINELKKINDNKGHAVGDLLIIRFSQALKIAKQKGEQVFRIGGDEFVVIAEVGRAQDYVDSMHRTLEGEQITFSYGFETTLLKNFDDALAKADAAMYKMKSSLNKGGEL
ncbi:GGDEF domain-containing protein [Vibrio sp. ZSDE26]|uniref:diguanylate cyclase n=1 Tax=Vibrio amylolyticus TaxID=2847292 RepID=A0A9X1XL76_9VIBR|nr:GGDEF domain-containing protein [Vibrio amylolyticus]MCK6264992.1 GGDEF domain-containing protein [Vibrio amylolyticus]